MKKGVKQVVTLSKEADQYLNRMMEHTGLSRSALVTFIISKAMKREEREKGA